MAALIPAAPKLKVLISGAGIAGPCLAYWLSRTRLDTSIKVVERSPVPRVTGQAVDIRGSAIEVVRRMKLEEAILARNTTEEGTTFVDSSGKTVAQFDMTDSNSPTSEYEILRADLAELFMGKTEKLKNVEFAYGNSIVALEQGDDVVKVKFKTGPEEKFDLVVAADGSTSSTRPLILDEAILKDSYNFLGQYTAFFSIPRQETDPKTWQWYSAPKGLAAMLRPHRNPKTMGAYLVITTPAWEQRDPVIEEALSNGIDAQKRMLREYFTNAGWQTERLLKGMDNAEDFYMSRIAKVKIPQWINGRALVFGDAAHATMGVGTALAIESAYTLAGELSKIQSSKDVPEALRKYEDIFRPLVEKGGDIPRIFPQAACPQTSWGLGLRNYLLWFVTKSKLYKLLPGDGKEEFRLPEYDWTEDEDDI